VKLPVFREEEIEARFKKRGSGKFDEANEHEAVRKGRKRADERQGQGQG